MSFSDDGVVRFPEWTTVLGLHAAADGATLAHLGRVDSGGTLLDSAVAKLTSNGAVDPTFAAAGATPGILQLGGPTPPVFLQRDGRFVIGATRYRADGSVDLVSPGLAPGLGVVTYFETGAGQLISVQDTPAGSYGCTLAHHHPDNGVPGVTIGLDARCERALVLPDGDGAVVITDHSSEGLHFVYVNGDGRLNTSRGGGTGVVRVDPAGTNGTRLVDAAWRSDRILLLLDESGSDASALLASAGRDGQFDTAFGTQGIGRVSGNPLSFDVNAEAITVHLDYTFTIREGSPYHPTIVSLRPDGSVNADVNPHGVVPGWWDIVDLGFADFVLDGAHLHLGDYRVMIGFGPYSRPGDGVTILVVEPTAVRIGEIMQPGDPLRPANRVSPPTP